jgi:two-component system, NarL family, sensor kinase
MQTSNSQVILFTVIVTGIVFLLALLIILLLYLYKRQQTLHLKSFNTLKLDFEKNLLRSQVEIQEQTFQNISRDIHDNINLSLTLAKLNLNTLDWNDTNTSASIVRASVDILSNVINELRDLSKGMNTELIKNIGLGNALQKEIEKINKMTNIKVKYNILGEPIYLESEKELVIFRIIQESFNNILKHASASSILLQLVYSKKYLDILIKDDGIGFSKNDLHPEQQCGKAGIINMQTRAKAFGGKVLLETWPQKGTQVLINVPY